MGDGRNNGGEMNERKREFFRDGIFYLVAFMATFVILFDFLNSAIWSALRRK
jgi:hypothetical protein